MKQGVSKAQANKRLRQDALREQLSNSKHLRDVEKIADKLQAVDTVTLSGDEVARLKSSADIKLKLINKYLPDLKQQELTLVGDEDNPVQHKHTFDAAGVIDKVKDVLSSARSNQGN